MPFWNGPSHRSGRGRSSFQPRFFGFDERFEIAIETGAPFPGNHSSGDHRSLAGTRPAEIVEGGTPSRLGGTEKVTTNRVRFCTIGGRRNPAAYKSRYHGVDITIPARCK